MYYFFLPYQDGSGRINAKLLSTVLLCCGFLETHRKGYRQGRRDSKWDMFEYSTKRRESKWDVFDTNLFSNNFGNRKTSIYDEESSDMGSSKEVSKRDVRFAVNTESKISDSQVKEENDKQASIIKEIMGLIDRTNTGMVEFPEFIETITVKILKDAVTAGFRGIFEKAN